jgi:TatD DNase family protein
LDISYWTLDIQKMFLNLHTHHPQGDPAILEIENLDYHQALSGRTRWYSAGIHPWLPGGSDLAAAGNWLRQHAGQPDCLAIGETGLDKLSSTPWALQQDAFRLCIQVALAHDKPLVLHCVRAHAEVLALIVTHKADRFVFHGFDKHPQTAGMLLDAGAFLSFGTALFREKSHAADAFRACPDERFFLETDDRDRSIRDIYTHAAAIRNTTPEALAGQIRSNAARFFRREDLL